LIPFSLSYRWIDLAMNSGPLPERLTPSRRQTALPEQDSAVWSFAATPRRRSGLRGFFQGDLQGLGLEHLVGKQLLHR